MNTHLKKSAFMSRDGRYSSAPGRRALVNSAILLALATTQPAIAVEGDALDAGAPILVNQTTAGKQAAVYREGDLGVDANGNFVAVWTDYDNYVGREVVARRFNADGTPRGDEFVVNTNTTGNQTANGVAVSPGGAFIVVFNNNNDGIYARLYGADGVAVGEPILVETAEFPGGSDAQVAMAADGRFVVVWMHYSVIYYRRFAADGTPLDTDAVEVMNAVSPGVAMDPAGNYVIVGYTSSYNILARRYRADGTALDVAGVSVNENSGDDQFNADVAMDAAGNYVISWVVDYAPVAGVQGVYFRRFAADGTALGGDVVTVSNEMPDSAWAYFQMSRVAMSADGSFAVTGGDALSPGADGDGYGTYMQRYDSSGNALYASPVNVGGAAGSDFLASVKMDADGDTVVLYQNYNGDDGDGNGVYAERYEGAGHTVDLSLVGNVDSGELGSAVSYGFTASNYGDGYALAVKLEDVLPGGVSYSGFSSTDDWSCGDSGGTVTCSLPSLAPGVPSTVNISVDTSGVSGHYLDNTATLSNAVTDTNSSDNSYTVNLFGNHEPLISGALMISGTALVGNTLSAGGITPLDADGDALTLSYQWRAEGVAIAGAGASSYTLTSNEAHQNISVEVTADDGYGGIANVASGSVSVGNSAPAFTGTPAISGIGAVGESLSVSGADTSDIDGDSVTLSYQWQLDGNNLSGATSGSYTVQAGDAGGDISVTVTASDGNGGNTSVITSAVTIAEESTASSSGGGGAFGWLELLLGLVPLWWRRRFRLQRPGRERV